MTKVLRLTLSLTLILMGLGFFVARDSIAAPMTPSKGNASPLESLSSRTTGTRVVTPTRKRAKLNSL